MEGLNLSCTSGVFEQGCEYVPFLKGELWLST